MSELKQRLAARANGETAIAERRPADTFEALLLKHEDQFRMALPKAVGFERFMRAALSTIRSNSQLRQCDAVSVMGALMTSAQLGLEIGPLGYAYLVPFNDRRSGKKLAQFIIGYRGMLKLARNSGEIKSVMVEPFYQNDAFEYELGLNPNIKHVPVLTNRGNRLGYYGIAHFNNGGYQIRVMSMEEIYARRNRSASWNSPHSPWKTDEDSMCRKTVLRAMWSWLPMAIEAMEAVASDETIRIDPSGDAEYIDANHGDGSTIDGDYTVDDAELDNKIAELDAVAEAAGDVEQATLV